MKKRCLTYACLLFAALIITGGVAVADDFPMQSGADGSGELSLEIDQAQFFSDNLETNRLEIYYKIYNDGFVFAEKDSVWSAAYDLMIALYDDAGVQVDRFEKQGTLKAASLRQTVSRSDFLTSMTSFDSLPDGKYRVHVYLSDASGTGTASVEYETKLRRLREDVPTVSDILFAFSAGSQGAEPHLFDRGNLLVVPSVSRTYGSMTNDRLLVYMELYTGDSEDNKVVIETKIRNDGNKMMYRDTLTASLKEPITRQLREFSLAEYPPGRYDFEIRLRGRRFKELGKQVSGFTILWDQAALIQHDFETAVGQLDVISKPGELDSLKAARTPEERRRAFEQYWKDKDPTPGTEENEVKREFYHRINYANFHFSVMRRPGWKTDRGRVYIQNGAPDQIDDVPMSPSDPPYQRWHYYQDGRYRRFTFVDENYDGEYRLIYPFDGLNQRPDF
jgi:GWxTD domain-containing protein